MHTPHPFPSMVADSLTTPTWERYTVLSVCIGNLSVKDRRRIFQIARSTEYDWEHLFMPHYGFTLSEFAVWYVLFDQRRRSSAPRKAPPPPHTRPPLRNVGRAGGGDE